MNIPLFSSGGQQIWPLLISIAMVGALSGCSATIDGQSDAETLTQRGNSELVAGVYASAIADFTQALRLEPKRVEALNGRARAYDRSGQGDQAVQDWYDAIKINPDNAEAFAGIGDAFRLKGQLDRAIKDLDEAIRLRPDDVAALESRGRAYYAKANCARAVDDFSRVVELRPDAAAGWSDRAAALSCDGQFERAIPDYTAELAIDPNAQQAYVGRGTAYYRRYYHAHDAEALADLDRAVELNPSDAGTRNIRGWLEIALGKLDLAAADFAAAISADPQQSASLYGRGMVRLKQGDAASGQRDITAARALNRTVDADIARSGFQDLIPTLAADGYLRLLKDLLEKQEYLLSDTLLNGRRGDFTADIVLDRTGRLLSVGITKSSGYADIDARAIQAIKALGSQWPAPPVQYLINGTLKLAWRAVFPRKTG